MITYAGDLAAKCSGGVKWGRTGSQTQLILSPLHSPNSASAPSLSSPPNVVFLYITVSTPDFHTLPLLLIAPWVYHLHDQHRHVRSLILKNCKIVTRSKSDEYPSNNNTTQGGVVFERHFCACWSFCMAAVSFTFILSLFPTSLTEILLGRLKKTATNQRKRHWKTSSRTRLSPLSLYSVGRASDGKQNLAKLFFKVHFHQNSEAERMLQEVWAIFYLSTLSLVRWDTAKTSRAPRIRTWGQVRAHTKCTRTCALVSENASP